MPPDDGVGADLGLLAQGAPLELIGHPHGAPVKQVQVFRAAEVDEGAGGGSLEGDGDGLVGYDDDGLDGCHGAPVFSRGRWVACHLQRSVRSASRFGGLAASLMPAADAPPPVSSLTCAFALAPVGRRRPDAARKRALESRRRRRQSRGQEAEGAATLEAELDMVAGIVASVDDGADDADDGAGSGGGDDDDDDDSDSDAADTGPTRWSRRRSAEDPARDPTAKPDAREAFELVKAVQDGNVDLLLRYAELRGERALRRWRTADGRSLMHMAAFFGAERSLLLLHQLGIDATLAAGDGRETACHSAAYRGHAGCVGLLADLGADADALDAAGRTPRQRAIAQGRAAVEGWYVARDEARALGGPPGDDASDGERSDDSQSRASRFKVDRPVSRAGDRGPGNSVLAARSRREQAPTLRRPFAISSGGIPLYTKLSAMQPFVPER